MKNDLNSKIEEPSIEVKQSNENGILLSNGEFISKRTLSSLNSVGKNFDYIDITMDLIDEVNTLQTGGTMHYKELKNVVFNNNGMEYYFENFNKLKDYLFYIGADEADENKTLIFDFLCLIKELERHFNALRCKKV